MRPSTTSAATDRARTRRRLAAVLGTELVCAALLISGPLPGTPVGPAVAAPSPTTGTAAPSGAPLRTVTTPDGRTAQLIDLGGGAGALLDRVAAELPGAEAAVSAFWGPQWPREIPIVVAGSPEQFAVLAGAGADTAATTTAERITFSPAAGAMDPADLRIVLRHELFHYAARAGTAADAPVWLTEGVADFVGRPAPSVLVGLPERLPTDADLVTPGPQRSAAYDRAWAFATHVAQAYGADRLRALYVGACGPGHSDTATAVRDVLGIDLPA
ncbi:peptidase [Mycolicibacterium psychrotolerans]|uniref:Peptidase n=1 Tax=Mycolicibacterium psychrotolerans TaxID=216929 RepID=A0A7I7MBJ6_9MYCO|nr:peptidase [Mycolicibacterium psychrotolerans]BBX69648.1 peptidase [Mycolicibacterium psychrotolerans]